MEAMINTMELMFMSPCVSQEHVVWTHIFPSFSAIVKWIISIHKTPTKQTAAFSSQAIRPYIPQEVVCVVATCWLAHMATVLRPSKMFKPNIRAKILFFSPGNHLLCLLWILTGTEICLAFLFTLKLVILPRHKRVAHAQMSVMMCMKVVSKWKSFSLALWVPVLLFRTSWLPRLKNVKKKNSEWNHNSINMKTLCD